MKKELPKIYKNQINKKLNTNQSVFKDNDIKKRYNVDDLFIINNIYRKKVIITKDNVKKEETIIGRTQNNLITINNEIIPIKDITYIEEL